MKLSELKTGERGVIVKVYGHGSFRKRIIEMGFVKGNKVKVALRFRGREMAHMATGKEVLDTFLEKVSDIAVVEKPAKLEGRSMIMVLAEKR